MAAEQSPFERLKQGSAGDPKPTSTPTATPPSASGSTGIRSTVLRELRASNPLPSEFAALGVLVPILQAIAASPGSAAPIEQRKDALKEFTDVSRRVAQEAFMALASRGPMESGVKVRLQAMVVEGAAQMHLRDGELDAGRLGETFRDAIERLSSDLQACCQDFAEVASAEIQREASERQDLLIASSRVVFLLSGELLKCEADQFEQRKVHVDQLARKIFAETQESPLYARLERGARFAHACELAERLSQLVVGEYQHAVAAGPIDAAAIESIFRRAQGNYRYIERIAIDVVERHGETEAGERHESMA